MATKAQLQEFLIIVISDFILELELIKIFVAISVV